MINNNITMYYKKVVNPAIKFELKKVRLETLKALIFYFA